MGYALTKRKGFEEILSAHCKVRGKQNGEYDQTAKGKGKGKDCAKKVKTVQTKKNSKAKKKKEKGGAKITQFFAKPKGKAETKKKANEKSLDDLSSDDE